MLKSMTAYGRSDRTSDIGHMTVEIQSVNRRYLEIQLSLPNELSHLETEVRNRLRYAIRRGAISVRIVISDNPSQQLRPNRELLQQLKSGWEEVAVQLGFDKLTGDQWVTLLGRRTDLFLREENDLDAWEPLLVKTLTDAIAVFQKMRIKEGRALEIDLEKRIDFLQEKIEEISLAEQGSVDRYQLKIEQRLADLVGDLEGNQERLLREIALYADRIDIAEEITRVCSHLLQMRSVIENRSEEGIGKKLDFLSQELLREFNTIGSKSPESEVIQMVIDAKSELERIREQVQNVE